MQENIKKITSQKDSVNVEHHRAVDTIKKYKEFKKYDDNLKAMEKMKGLEEDLENAYKLIDIISKNTYDNNGLDIYVNHKDTGNEYDPNGFNRNGYNINGVDKNGYDMYGPKKKSSKIKTSKAKSFKDQKGKGYVDLPILLSKLNINSTKELISNIEQLINNLYINKQITKQVYNILNKTITYKNDL